MRIVYNKNTGQIISAIGIDQVPDRYYRNRPEEFIKNIDYIDINNVPFPLCNYFIKDGEICEYNDEEKFEIRRFGKILTVEERLLEKLKPSLEEVENAKQTIKILSLMQEVM